MEHRGQFTFYSSIFESARRIRNKAARAEFYDAICDYALNGTEPDLDKMSDAAAIGFISAKPNLDASRKKAKSGKAGGSVTQSASKQQANSKQTLSKPQANAKQTASEKEREKEKEKEIEDECPRARACFGEFWEKYPNQVGKEAAVSAWESMAVSPEDMKQILEGLERWKRSLEWEKNGGQFIPRPARWLSEKRWLEYPVEAAPKGATGQLGAAELEAIQRVMRGDTA